MPSIHLSFSDSDKLYAQQLTDHLRQMHQEVWSIFDLAPGVDWRTEISQSLRKSDAVVILISPKSQEQHWLMYEAGMAAVYHREHGRPTVIPVILRGARLPSPVQDHQALFAKGLSTKDVADRICSAVVRASAPKGMDLGDRNFPGSQSLAGLPSNVVVEARFEASGEVQPWTILSYLEELVINHSKLLMIQRIGELLGQKMSPEDFQILWDQEDIFAGTPPAFSGLPQRSMGLGYDKSIDERFWKTFHHLKRPLVLFRAHERWVPLIWHSAPQTARVRKLTQLSPVEVSLTGAGGAILDLIYGPSRELRNVLAWQNEQSGISAENLEKIARASQILANPNTPPAIRMYITDEIIFLLERQNKFNKLLSIKPKSVNLLG